MEILQFRMVDTRNDYCAQRGRHKKQEAELIDEQEKLTMTDHSLPRRHMHGSMETGGNTIRREVRKTQAGQQQSERLSRDWQLTIVIAVI